MKFLDSPFIMKIKYKKPSTTQAAKNIAHIDYISGRPGVELNGEMELDENTELSSDDVYTQYIGERPKSHGLFDQNGPANIVEAKEEIANHEGTTWRMILSLNESDANRLGYTNKAAWENMLRATMADATLNMGIKESNLKWYAAFHQEAGHPHVHVIFFDKSLDRTKDLLSPAETRNMKKTFMKEIYEEERTLLNIEKTAMRDLVRSLGKENIQEATILSKELNQIAAELKEQKILSGKADENIAPRIRNEHIKELSTRLNELGSIMPGKGRIVLKYMPEEVKEKAKETADYLMNCPQFKESLYKYDKAIEGMTRQYTLSQDKINEAIEKGREDLRNRLAQVVLQGAAKSQRKEIFTIDESKIQINLSKFKSATLNTDDEKIIRNYTKSLLIMGEDKESIKEMLKNASGIEEEKINKLVDNQDKKIKELEEWQETPVISKQEWEELNKALGIKTDYMWKTESNSNNLSMVNSVWKSVWKNIDQEMQRREMMLRVEERQAEMRAEYIRRQQEELSRGR